MSSSRKHLEKVSPSRGEGVASGLIDESTKEMKDLYEVTVDLAIYIIVKLAGSDKADH